MEEEDQESESKPEEKKVEKVAKQIK